MVLLGCGRPLRAQSSPAERILHEIDRSQTLEANLRVICDEIGPRMTGTASMRKGVEWAVEAFRRAGVDEVHTESFKIPVLWGEGETRVEALAPARFRLEAVATAWSPATPKGGVEAEVLDAGGGSPGRILRLGAKARGKILLVRLNQVSTFFGLGVEQRDAIIAMREAAQVGAAALVFASTRPNRLLYRHIHTVTGELDPLPSAVLTREDALRIGRLIEAGHTVKMRLSMPNRTRGPVEGRNVVAEIRGAEKPQEVVILGAHFDSWDLGTGCLDNGVNVALTLETARAVAAAGVRPRRTLRFILFGAEEEGLLGSLAYVRRHRAELDNIVAVLIHDMGLGKIEGYSLGGRPELEAGLREAMRPIASLGANRHTPEAFFGSDHFDFLLEGVPALVAMQDTSAYAPTYHSEADTFDKVSVSQLRDRTRVAAVTAYGVADLPGRLGKRLNRTEVENLLESSGLDKQLKFLRLWRSWEKGERGRAPEPGG